MKGKKVYLVMLCQVYNLIGGSTMLSEYPIMVFGNEYEANKERDKCMQELKNMGRDTTREWFKTEYRFVK